MEFQSLIGHGEDLSAWHMSVRAIILFFVTLVLIRFGGFRIFGKKSTADTIVMITLGAVMARGIVGASPLLSVIAASVTIITTHRLLAWLCLKNRFIEKVINGNHVILYQDGKILNDNLNKTSLTQADLLESLRLETQSQSLDKIETAYMETNGRISFIVKKHMEDY